MSKKFRRSISLIAALALPLALAACGGAEEESADGGGTIDYWLWDSNQQPAYQQCADAFEKDNPDLKIKITQRGWDDYWGTLSTGFQSDTAPDVFTDHLSQYPQFVENGVLLPLDDVIDDIDTGAYADGLADLWVGQDGKRYGLPKDWDTIGLFYNKKMIEEAGITEEEMKNLDWNPEDGGSYEEVIAKLTVDKSGVRGDEPGFDKENVAVYGLGLPGSGGGNGQTEWSYFAATTGWTHTTENPWGTEFKYDDPAFQDSIAWWKGLIDKGYMPTLEATVGASMNDNFGAGQAAINANGSWMINSYAAYEGLDLGIAPTPVGPSGKRASMFNGLADSIYAGTENPEGAGAWVEYLGSAACQDVIGKAAVVFPAIPSGSDAAVAAWQEKGLDVTAFTQHVTDGTTFLFPITQNAADVGAIMSPAMDAVMSGKEDPSSLTGANDQVNALFE